MMFFHNFKYEMKYLLKRKEFIFWIVLFPIILGAFFKIAFSNIYENTEVFRSIPIAIVEEKENTVFRTVMDGIENSDDPLFKAEYTDKDSALELLKNKDVKGIIYLSDKTELSVSADGIEQTIIKTFVEQYQIQETIIKDTAIEDPAKIQNVIDILSKEISCSTNVPLTEGNPDIFISYFYNLIAMVALLGSTNGLYISIANQGNLSALGARKCCSPASKWVSLSASLLANYIVHAGCMIISVSYTAFILRVDFGDDLPFVYLSGITGGILGVSMGFMIGSIGKLGENAKNVISITVSLLSCFLSGLMMGNMKAIIAEKLPWFNEINPAALISDTFYCLNVYSDYDRYIQKNITILIISAVFAATGLLLTRRRKYASI